MRRTEPWLTLTLRDSFQERNARSVSYFGRLMHHFRSRRGCSTYLALRWRSAGRTRRATTGPSPPPRSPARSGSSSRRSLTTPRLPDCANAAPNRRACGPTAGSLRVHPPRTARGRQLQQPDTRFGSASAGRALDLTAGKLTPKLSDRIADARGRQYPTHCRRCR